jgi:peroxiredoxin
VIGKDKKIEKVFTKVQFDTHAGDVLEALK